MFDHPFTATDAAIALAAFLLLWYVAGMQVKRRRAVTLLRQVRDSIQPFGGAATIRWIGRSAFRIEAEKLPAPFARLSISVLLERTRHGPRGPERAREGGRLARRAQPRSPPTDRQPPHPVV
jgi:hypothetical protein